MFKLLTTLSALTSRQLKLINSYLADRNLPPIGLKSPNNKLYQTAATPRFTISWRGLRLTQVYLYVYFQRKDNPKLYWSILNNPDMPNAHRYVWFDSDLNDHIIKYPLTVYL